MIILIISLLSSMTFSAPSEVNPRRAAGGMASEFSNVRLNQSSNPIPLTNKALNDLDKTIIKQAEAMFDSNASLSIVLVEKGELVFEKYKAPSDSNTVNFSWSMSKSLTAYTIGGMSCEGIFPDLNKPAQTYSPDLVKTVYGEATIKNLLTMSSGVRQAISAGNLISKKSGTCDPARDCDGWLLQRSGLMTGLDLIKHDPDRDISWGRPVASGSRFAYNATDTLSLSNIAENNGGFIKNFDKHIWSKTGSTHPGFWLVDKDGKAMSQAGFSATSKDWARLAMFTVKQLKSEDKCLSNFMKAATTEQLPNLTGEAGKAFKGYGYQTWIMNARGINPSYWWVGFGGQRVGVDPVSEKIIVVTSFREDYMEEIYQLFQRWQKH
jgi:CubicO group peptidase (beta-lactamase class C family)